MLKKLFSHSLIYGIAPQISKIAGIIALPIITKDLTEIDYGIWGIIMAYIAALEALATLGMGVELSNSFYKMPSQFKWLWRQIYGFLAIWSIGYAFIAGIILWLVIPEEARDNAFLIVVLLMSPKMLFGPITVIGNNYYQLSQNPLPIALRTGCFGVLTVILNIYTISHLKLGYMGWVWSLFIVDMLMHLSYFIPLVFKIKISPIFNFKWSTIKKSLNVTIPTIPHQYASFLLNSSDRIVMDTLKVKTADLGGYNLASSFGGYMGGGLGASLTAAGPMMLECYKKKLDKKARDLVFLIQGVHLIATFFFCIWSKEIFELLIKNDSLKQFYPLAIIIVMAYNYRPMYIGAMAKLFYTENTKLLWQVSFVAGFSNVILNFIFIPIYGYEAAAYTTFISFMYMGFAGHFIKKIKAIHDVTYYPLIWLFLIILLTIAAYFIVEQSIVFKIILTLVLSSLFVYMSFKYRFLLKRV